MTTTIIITITTDDGNVSDKLKKTLLDHFPNTNERLVPFIEPFFTCSVSIKTKNTKKTFLSPSLFIYFLFVIVVISVFVIVIWFSLLSEIQPSVKCVLYYISLNLVYLMLLLFRFSHFYSLPFHSSLQSFSFSL